MKTGHQRFAANPLLEGGDGTRSVPATLGGAEKSSKPDEGPPVALRLPSTLLWLAAWLNLVFVVGVWAALYWGCDRWWWATVIAYMPRWMWTAPLVALWGLAIGGWGWGIANCKLQIANRKLVEGGATRSRRSAVVALLLATIWVAWPLMGLCVPWGRIDDEITRPHPGPLPEGEGTGANGDSLAPRPRTLTASTIRVLTCNVGLHAYDPIEMAALVAENDPDLIAVQEDIKAEELAALVPPGWHVAALRDLAIASRWPISNVENLSWSTKYGPRPNALRVRVHVPPLPPGEGRGEGGVDQAAGGENGELSVGAKSPHPSPLPEGEGIAFDFVALHLFTPRGGLEAVKGNEYSAAEKMQANMELRSDESTRVRRWIGTLPGPVIVAGDMNMPPESSLFKRDWNGFADAFSTAGWGYGYTYGYTTSGWFYGIRIDHILADAGWRVQNCWVGRHIGSDHRPVVAELAR